MQTSKIKDVASFLESLAPLAYQESYDNAGLLVGDPSADTTGILVALDCTEAVVEEAIELNCNMVVAHHPVIFKGLKRLTGRTYVERTVMKALRHDIALYAIHTNLDNVFHGVNQKIADKIGLINTRILAPSRTSLSKLVAFVPPGHADTVLQALYDAGAGQIGNYKDCSFQLTGRGTFRPDENAKPFIGSPGQLELVTEVRIEVIFPESKEKSILAALKSTHPYEEVAYYASRLENENQEIGAGLFGELPAPEEPIKFLGRLKNVMQAGMIRHTQLPDRPFRKVAVCGGSGSFLLADAIAESADVFISADFKYHEFFDADGKIVVADIGHYESEQYTKDLLVEVLSKKFPTFAINFSKTVTNPISYL